MGNPADYRIIREDVPRWELSKPILTRIVGTPGEMA
jgi:hypothetical protein